MGDVYLMKSEEKAPFMIFTGKQLRNRSDFVVKNRLLLVCWATIAISDRDADAIERTRNAIERDSDLWSEGGPLTI